MSKFDELVLVSVPDLESVLAALDHFVFMEDFSETNQVVEELRAARETMEAMLTAVRR